MIEESIGNKIQKSVSWATFIWVIGIITLCLGWSFNTQAQLSEKVDVYSGQLLEIRTQLSQIQTDLVWIKGKI